MKFENENNSQMNIAILKLMTLSRLIEMQFSKP